MPTRAKKMQNTLPVGVDGAKWPYPKKDKQNILHLYWTVYKLLALVKDRTW